MSDRSALIESLNEAIRIEHTLAMQCFQQSQTVRGLWRLQLVPFLEGLGEEARQHARKFAQKVVALGGVPTVAVGDVTLSEGAEEMLHDNLALERSAMAAYLRVLELVGDDVPMRTLLEDHIEGEQRHIEELELLTRTPTSSDAAHPTVRRVS